MVDSTNLPNVDINQIATDLNGKMDRDCLNASDTGNIQMAKASMPSNKYINLTLGASGTNYTAPADGWFLSRQQYNSGYYDISIGAINLVETNTSSTQLSFLVPARKGQILQYNYSNLTTGLNYTKFRFIYAQGSESEV